MDLFLAYSRGFHALSPWRMMNEDELRVSALTLEAAHRACVSEMLLGEVSRNSRSLSGKIRKIVRKIDSTIHSEILRFDGEDVEKMLKYWRDVNDDGLSSWPDSAELFSTSAERYGQKIALSISLDRCKDIAENMELTPLAPRGIGRILSLNLVCPYDEYCIVYFVKPFLPSVEGRWTWMPKDDDNDCDKPKRRIFQTRGEPQNDFRDFLTAVCDGVEIRIVVICTGVSSSHRDWRRCRQLDTLFGYDMSIADRPWYDFSARAGCLLDGEKAEKKHIGVK
jgi:hypothetical protein